MKAVMKSQVWHYPNVQKSARYPIGINMSMCGTLYRTAQKNYSAPICRRCLALEGFGEFKEKPKVKLPKSIREQSIEPPEVL
jgi:hypothetical protein